MQFVFDLTHKKMKYLTDIIFSDSALLYLLGNHWEGRQHTSGDVLGVATGTNGWVAQSQAMSEAASISEVGLELK